MASSLSRKLSALIFSKYTANLTASNPSPLAFCSRNLSSSSGTDSESDTDSVSPPPRAADSPPPNEYQPNRGDRPLENGLDLGIYKAILVGQVGQAPIQKRLKSGRTVTLISIGTGGIRNNRRPLDNEDPRDYANRCAVQWHRVSVYPEKLGDLAMKSVVPGSILYLEGNLETKIFNDPITGLVRRIREVAIRRNGRLLFLGNGAEAEQHLSRADIGRVGYY